MHYCGILQLLIYTSSVDGTLMNANEDVWVGLYA